jgi:hypothetical protein
MRERICLRAVADRSPARALDVCAGGREGSRVFVEIADSSFSSPQLFVSSPAENDASGHHEARLE